MDMRMVHQLLIPGVQHAEEPDFGAQMLRIRATWSSVSALARNSRL